jgi:hypothetical protein
MGKEETPSLRRKAYSTGVDIFRFALVFFVGYSFHACSPKFDIYANEADWMPEGASDGIRFHYGTAYIIGPPFYCYEFDIPEGDFARFMKERGKELKEVEEAIYVRRYLASHVRRNEFDHEGNIDESWSKYRNMTEAKITNGLIYSMREEYGDDEYTYAYDRNRGRAFIYLQSR